MGRLLHLLFPSIIPDFRFRISLAFAFDVKVSGYLYGVPFASADFRFLFCDGRLLRSELGIRLDRGREVVHEREDETQDGGEKQELGHLVVVFARPI